MPADLSATFESIAPKLFAIAYRMVGSVDDTEDLLQDCRMMWLERGDDVSRAEGFLVTAMTRRCLNWLTSGRQQRESYVGPWLPEPLMVDATDPLHQVVAKDEITYALMVLFEALSPVERAVWILRHSFDLPYREVAEALSLSSDSCRQHHRRAKRKLAAVPAPRPHTLEAGATLMARLAEAVQSADVGRVCQLLADDITFVSDGGGKAVAALKPIVGDVSVARFLLGLQKNLPESARSEYFLCQGMPSLGLWEGDALTSLLLLDVGETGVRRVFSIRNPDKLTRAAQQLETSAQKSQPS